MCVDSLKNNPVVDDDAVEGITGGAQKGFGGMTDKLGGSLKL